MNPPRYPGDRSQLADLRVDDATRSWDWEGVEEWINGVLTRARQRAEAADGPDALRGLLYVTRCFADELATANPRFDRLRFIRAATEGPS
jgi:hypothetical protein